MRGGERAVGADGVALEIFGFLVEVEMAAVLQAEVGAAGEHQREVRVAVAVAVGHAAAEKRHRGAEERFAAEVLGLRESREEVAELLDGEGVVVGELLDVTRIAAVMAELVARLGDADFGNGEGIAFTAKAEGGHARHIRLKGQHHEIIDGAEKIACQGLGDVAVGPFPVGVGNGRQRRVEPGIGPARANLRLAHGGEVLLHAPFVFLAHLLLELAHFREIGVEHAAFAAQATALDRLPASRFFEERSENLAAMTHRGQLHAVCSPGKGLVREGDLQ